MNFNFLAFCSVFGGRNQKRKVVRKNYKKRKNYKNVTNLNMNICIPQGKKVREKFDKHFF